MRISQRSSEAADPFSVSARRPCSITGHRHLEPSSAPCHTYADRTETVRCTFYSELLSLCGTEDDTLENYALVHELP
jgi:hypothetical protein